MPKPIFIASAKRTAVGAFNGCFSHTPATELGSASIRGCMRDLPKLSDTLDQAYFGCVLTAGLGQAPARQAVLGAGLPHSTPCTTINKVCGSSMQTVIFGINTIAAEQASVVLAGGFENMSRAPYLLPQARQGYRLGHAELKDHMLKDGLEDAYQNAQSMAYFAEQCAEHYGIDREQQDAFAMQSLQRSQQAIKENRFAAEIAPVSVQQKKQDVVITSDQGPQSFSIDKIPTLKPIVKADGSITAANASSISDGAASLVLADKIGCQQLQAQPMARIVAQSSYAHQPQWFTTAPIEAIKAVAQRAQWDLATVDLFEINEAFAVVALVTQQALDIPLEKINIHGGACALGHPIGASGARIIVTLIHALEQHQLKRGIASLCIGGGEATAIAIELID